MCSSAIGVCSVELPPLPRLRVFGERKVVLDGFVEAGERVFAGSLGHEQEFHFQGVCDYKEVEVAVVVVALSSDAEDDALSVGTTEGASTMTVRVLVEVRPFWSVAT